MLEKRRRFPSPIIGSLGGKAEMSSDRTVRKAMQVVPTGKYLRFPSLYERASALVVCPVDDLLIFGPRNGLEDASSKIAQIIRAKPDAVLTFAGSVSRMPEMFCNTRYILNLTASTVRSQHTRKVRSHTIMEALRLNAAAVAIHINLRSVYAPEMIELAGNVICEAQCYDLPTIGIIYPRGEKGGVDDNLDEMRENDVESFSELIAHCVALGSDLGFDAVKTIYTGSVESFRRVTDASRGMPVWIAGGPMKDATLAIQMAMDGIRGGAAGVSFGRNVFGRDDPVAFVNKLRQSISCIDLSSNSGGM